MWEYEKPLTTTLINAEYFFKSGFNRAQLTVRVMLAISSQFVYISHVH